MPSAPERNIDDMNKVESSQNERDLPDSPEDERVMEEAETVFDLPDVADIPGQENIVPPKMGMFVDTTISSDGEEGTELFGDDDEEDQL